MNRMKRLVRRARRPVRKAWKTARRAEKRMATLNTEVTLILAVQQLADRVLPLFGIG